MNQTRTITTLFSLILLCQLQGQVSDEMIYRAGINSITEFRQLLAIPNDANYMDDILKNVSWCKEELEKRSFATKTLSTPTRPLLYAEMDSKPQDGKPVVLFYFHLDGQSVDKSFWFQGDPYDAVLKQRVEGEGWVDLDWKELSFETYDPDWYIFARSASDSKNNFMMWLTAFDLLKDANESIPFHLKMILDFEEEKSSPSLASTVSDQKELLKADMLVIFDGPRHISNEPTLSFGARGIASVTLTTYGPVFAQHSGHYGNYAPNPALKLSKLLASMKDDDGRVVIPGFYDGIQIDKYTEEILAEVPDDEKVIKAKLGIKNSDKVADTYQKALQYPSLNIRGMASGWVGSEARTIVPATATAEIDIRLVKESDPNRLIKLLDQHIREQGFFVTDKKPTQRERLSHNSICRMNSRVSYRAFRTDFDSDVGLWLTRAMTNAFGQVPIRHRTSGGSIPISPFVETLGVPAVSIPMANRDNNQHSPNENIRLGNYLEGVKTLYFVMRTPVKDSKY